METSESAADKSRKEVDCPIDPGDRAPGGCGITSRTAPELALSVVIPAHNDAHNLERLLTTLARHLPRVGVTEIIVVANGCVDETVACCHRYGVQCLDRPPLNPASARNEGAAAAHGQWLGFLDADTDPSEVWFDMMRDLVDGRVEGGTREIAGWPVLAPANASWVAHAWQLVRFSPNRLPGTLDCGNLVMTRALFDRLGGFNGRRIAGEDVEICERAIAAGHPLLFDARLAVYHYGEPGSIGEFLARELFHADPLPLILRNLRRSVVDITIALLLLSLLTAGAGIVAALVVRTPAFLWLLMPAVLVSAGAALAKAAARWHRGVSFRHFLEMTALCEVMLLARAAGTVIRRNTWRSHPRERVATGASSM